LGAFGLALLFALGVNGLGGIFSSRIRFSSSRESVGVFGMDERSQIFVAVGDALETWSDVESSLTSLFATLADFKDSRDASIISHKAHVIAKKQMARCVALSKLHALNFTFAT
jgi:hypothetical protein